MGSSVACIVQARMGSTRLPGKSLAKVYKNYSLLELVLRRVKSSKKSDLTILATSLDENCDELEVLAEKIGIITIRGSEEDVLGRFDKAIDIYKPESVVRICADNPLVSPEEIDRLIFFFQHGDFDYAANNTIECGLPDGLGCEIVKSEILKRISRIVEKQYYREHVTTYITSHQNKYNIGWLMTSENNCYPETKLDIDTFEDLERMRRFCKELPLNRVPFWTTAEIVSQINKSRCSNSAGNLL